ncbi:MAG TPA: hypothetical protein VMM13_20205, partial [Euzebya sp.]|nr:hypothetical protein [Euzebya sp.]
MVGYSDIATLLLPLTTMTGIATLHGQNLMDTPYQVPAPLTSWLDVVTRERRATVVQGAAPVHGGPGVVDYAGGPTVREYVLDQPGAWRPLDLQAGPVRASGRLIGGCIETVSILAGTPYGDLSAFAAAHA